MVQLVFSDPDPRDILLQAILNEKHITLSSLTEAHQPELTIVVPAQRSYTGSEMVISSSLADIPCAILGVQGMLDQLNVSLKTPYTTLDDPHLSALLEDCISNNYDFGTAYGRLRRRWYNTYPSHFLDLLHTHEIEDLKMRQDVFAGNQIVNPNMPPRRVWDLYSNRVIPYWVIKSEQWLWGISHAWVDEGDRVKVSTPINRHQWPVPIPKDANLDLIRLELLNLGAEYVWLDVLCLRQEGGREDLRADEWKLDRPTIGHVFRMATEVVCYFSGLGRPWTLKEGDLDSDRSWFRRAWTLQDVGRKMVIAGDTPDGPLHVKPEDQDETYQEMLARVRRQLNFSKVVSRGFESDVFNVLADMQDRVATNPVDKIAGLAFPLRSTAIAAYHELGSLEDAWTTLVDTMGARYRAQLFFLYPEPGNGHKKWRPSWDQVMRKPSLRVNGFQVATISWDEPPVLRDGSPDLTAVRNEEVDVDYHQLFCIDNVIVEGLAVKYETARRGQFIVTKEGSHGSHSFRIVTGHQYPIPEGKYTLINAHMESQYWVVGKRLPDQRFEKVSVFEMNSSDDIKVLMDLGVAKWSPIFLL
ncbi:uncharacterized protein ARMOST_18523 [Armillaria ostoyae]|uniref:Heterokaryon incompatibility domain-containing protein n=1 Tax=Armillaria ostoyae TaxID=47428 RepID=A0A284S1Z4_ARMOS|nr:uncharacterized protein ARMOST_18523 [Armillaria ostoyae]